MPYITREDGEHFVIPSYRDVLTAKNKSVLKKDIQFFSQSYGEYITLQRKSPTQYEVAFSPDTGYLLGESIWHYFKRPVDMIYCEAIPNTTEALLVIVKSGSVYLDGSFPIDSIPEELIIFLTQQNNFEIYVHGDVPISQTPEEGKFSFESASVKSFTVLDKPIFPTLPLLKMYQLQLVDTVLKAQGIGVFPARQIVIALLLIGILIFGYFYLTSPKQIVVTRTISKIITQNPFAAYFDALTSPAPDQEIAEFVNKSRIFFSMPGWVPIKVDYSSPNMVVAVQSGGSTIEALTTWAKNNDVAVNLRPEGVFLTATIPLSDRERPSKIYALNDVIGVFTDRLASVYPGNHLMMKKFENKGSYTQVVITLTVDKITPALLDLIGTQMQDMPFVLQAISFDVLNGNFSGTITLMALGS